MLTRVVKPIQIDRRTLSEQTETEIRDGLAEKLVEVGLVEPVESETKKSSKTKPKRKK